VRTRTEARYTGAEAFLAGKDFNKNNIIVQNGTIYSYGRHFPMAVKLDNGAIVVNTEKYSVTTSKHQRALFDTLSAAGYKHNGQYLGNGEIWAR
jgi:hypothetical protein